MMFSFKWTLKAMKTNGAIAKQIDKLFFVKIAIIKVFLYNIIQRMWLLLIVCHEQQGGNTRICTYKYMVWIYVNIPSSIQCCPSICVCCM